MAAPPTGIACPVYPWPQDASQRGPKVFMQSDCAACHSMLPYAVHRETAAQGVLVAQATEIVVAEEAQPMAAARPLRSGAPDITTIATKIQDGLRYNPYSAAGGAAVCQELKTKMAPPSSVWMQFAQPYLKAFQAA